MNYLIGLDIGTSSVKGILMLQDGQVVSKVREAFHYIRTADGRVEIEAQKYLDTCFRALKKLSDEAKDGEIRGICASSASGNTLFLDQNNTPITNIISWQDKRVTTEAKEILGDLGEDFAEKVGWPFSYKSFPLSQICWFKTHQPEILTQCGTIAMSTEYLYYILTGKWGISTSAGTTYYLIDQQTGEYMESLLDTLGICKKQLPPVMKSGEVVGYIQKHITERCGIPAGTPVVLGTFDHPSAARGAGILKEGEMLLSCGTSWVAFFPIKDRKKGVAADALVDPFLSPKGCYGAMTSIASLAERLKFYVNRYIDTSECAFNILSELAKQSISGANGLSINPLNEPDDENINSFSKVDIARAIMEGTVELLRDQLEQLALKGLTAQTAVMVGGPSEDPYWIQLIEETCKLSVRVVHGSYAGAVGAALICGIGVGEYTNEEEYYMERKMRKDAKN